MEYLVTPSTWLTNRSFVVAFVHVLIAAAVTVHTLMNKRDVPAAIGWIGMAWLAPVVGALLYVGFGINRVKRRARRMKGSLRSVDPLRASGAAPLDPIERLKVAITKITGQDISTGKVVAALACGDEAYPRMLAAIEGAKASIALSTYIFRADAVGLQFIAALARAHRRGVATRILIDGFGGGFMRSSAYRRLRRQGVPAARFLHSTLPWRMPFLDLRLHKKSLIVDGVSAFVGGLNIGAENLLASHPKAPVRDMHFLVEGTVVRQIAQQFEDDWSFRTGDAQIETRPSPDAASGEADAARAIAAGPDQEVDQLVLVLLSAIISAQQSIRIATPYFVPDEQLVTALQLAALRGVDVQLVLPEANNHRLVAWAVGAHVRPLLQSGCHIWRAPPPFDHSKLMTIDGKWSLANWDMRSLRLNFELTLESYDPDFAARMSAIIDARRARPLTLEEIDGRRFVVRLCDAAARQTTPYM